MFGSREFYGYEVHRVLASEGEEIEISRLYRVLNEMRHEGLLAARWAKSRVGPRKKMYRIGDKGRTVLNDLFLDAIKTVHMFYGMYLFALAPKINVLESLIQRLVGDLRDDEKIAFITMESLPMHELLVRHLHQKVPHGKIFLVKPSTTDVALRLPNLVSLDGFYNDIPVRRDYIDCLIAIDLPKQESLDRSIREWHKVLTSQGTLAILTPSILLDAHEDPVSIGAFIEKHEHETIEKGHHLDWEILEAHLHPYFTDIERYDIVHMAIVTASAKN
jgi:DNA-binding PadR family transcriptional regulator